jgi:hypothetical protein
MEVYDMEIDFRTITNLPRLNPMRERGIPQRNDTEINTTDSSTDRFKDVTMDLEEVKNFLFMMLRGVNVRAISNNDKVGINLNKFV